MSDASAKENGTLPNNLPAIGVDTNKNEMEKLKRILKTSSQLLDDVKHFRCLS